MMVRCDVSVGAEILRYQVAVLEVSMGSEVAEGSAIAATRSSPPLRLSGSARRGARSGWG
jgi:hypothetical protein